MRIAMLHVDLPPESRGGVAHQVARLSEALVNRGHDVTVFSFTTPSAATGFGCRRPPLASLARTKVGRLAVTPAAFALGRYADFDVVHAHGDSHLLVRRRTPVVRTFYGSALDEARHAARLRRKAWLYPLHAAERIARRTATVTVGISRATESSVGPLDSIVPCGVDVDRFHPGPKAESPAILFVGTLAGRKRGRLMLDLFRDTIRPALPNCELWFVGDEEVHAPGVRSFTRLSDDALAARFRSAWAFVLPSTYEGFGVPYIEAMASGTVPVATPNAGALEVLTPGSGGVIADDSQLPAALIELLRDEHLRRDLEQQALEASGRYDWDRICESYENIYRTALARATRARPRPVEQR
jgi:glycosyltransferase involved in cell wall biosynthesis